MTKIFQSTALILVMAEACALGAPDAWATDSLFKKLGHDFAEAQALDQSDLFTHWHWGSCAKLGSENSEFAGLVIIRSTGKGEAPMLVSFAAPLTDTTEPPGSTPEQLALYLRATDDAEISGPSKTPRNGLAYDLAIGKKRMVKTEMTIEARTASNGDLLIRMATARDWDIGRFNHRWVRGDQALAYCRLPNNLEIERPAAESF